MTETLKTLIYSGIAVVALLAAWWARPASIDRAALDDSGQKFFAEFDALNAKSLEIVSFSQASSERQAFKVAQAAGRWAIPSHEGYPADAQDHLAQAASSVMDLTKGTMVSDSSADHELYGVVDPTADAADPAGAGTRVTIQDESGHTLVDFIIGKPVKDSQDLRYVRVPGKDRVYTAAVKTDKLTTKFEDWIERDLLKLSAVQIKQIFIDDYAVDEISGTINRNEQLAFNYETKSNKWTFDDLMEGETLKTEKLDEMRNALRDLKIVDVRRKPAGLSAQLSGAGNVQLDLAAQASLSGHGYYLTRDGNLVSNQGETAVKTQDGVVYTLRFGEIAMLQPGAGENTLADSPESASTTGRYVFVTANFDQSLLEQPQYDPVPEPPPAPATQPEGPEGSAATQPTSPSDPARDAIIAANDKKRQDFEKKVADGQQKVKDLNVRFAEWYYVVSDDVYQKIRVCRADVVTTGATPTESE